MGVKANLAGLTFNAGAKSSGKGAYASDIDQLNTLAQLKVQEAINLITLLQTICTAGSDASNATTLGTQITNLS